MPIENIQVFLCVLRDLCVRTTFYDSIKIAALSELRWTKVYWLYSGVNRTP